MTATGTAAARRLVGRRVNRREDRRLLTGHGTFVDDITVPGLLHIAFVRADVARGRIIRLDVEPARGVEGVRAIFTARDLNPLVKEMWATLSGPPTEARPYPPARPLADGDVRFVGDPIAAVVADDRYVAEDAAELVDVEIEPLPPVLDVEQAIADDAHLVHPELGTNVASRVGPGDARELDELFASAAHVFTRTFRQARATNVPMEARGIIVHWQPYAEEMRIWVSSQNPHEVRAFCARLLGLPENRIRVTMDDVGGGFGQKVFVSRDEAAVMLAAYLLERPVKWIEDRRENLVAASQARSESATVSMAVDAEGRFLAARVHHVEELGAYPNGGLATVGGLVRMMFPGPYRIGRLGFTNVAVFTNTCGRAPYRGPWVIETLAREQLVDHIARQLSLDPLELRRRNVICPEDLPYETAGGVSYDVVSPQQTLEQAAAMLDYGAFREAQRRARQEGRYLGVGIGLSIEPSGAAHGPLSTDQATIRVEPGGQVSVLMGTGSSGNSLETTIPQIVADHLGCDFHDVVLQQGDTAAAPFGHGTAGSRSAPIAGGAARQAALAMRDKVLAIAAHAMDTDVDKLEIDSGRVSVQGTPSRAMSFAEIAALAYYQPALLPPAMAPGLEVVARFRPPNPYTWSNSCHVCTCEVDVSTGRVTLLRYLVSEDCGVLINPAVVEGQIAGGVVQGIGGVLYEHMAYDDTGNPLATTFLDYLLPTATEVPMLEYGHIETPSAIPGGYKGMGEGGAIAAPPAVANAIADALSPLGVAPAELLLGPSELLAALPGDVVDE